MSVTRNQAERMIASLVKMGECVDELDDTINTIPDAENQKALRIIIGPVLSAQYDLLAVLSSQYPDLEPYIE
jgi:hypothetical protein